MREKISMIGFVMILATILTGALSAVNSYTTPIIDKNQALKVKRSVLDAFGIAHAGKADVEAIFAQNIEVKKVADNVHYVTREKDVAFRFAGPGLWGPITGVIALRPDLKIIKGLTIIHQEETPGLGGRIGEQEYLERFKTKELMPTLTITSPGKASASNEVDGITGATLSCKAFEKILNSEASKYIPMIEGTQR